MMKKITAIVLSIFMIMATSTVVYAENTPYYQATQMSYEVPGSFMAMIPMEINAGDSVSISVQDVNIAENSQIAVSLCYLDENNEIRLANNDGTDYVYVKAFDASGNQLTTSNNLIGIFTTSNQCYTVNTEVQSTDGAKAGVYTGYMSFEFEIIDA